MNCEQMLYNGLKALQIQASDKGIASLCTYYAELVKWNQKMNLVAAAEMEEILEAHFLDSLTLLPILADSPNLLDIGSGAGFPGLVIKTVRPEMAVTLVEPRQKRVTFLKHIGRALELKNLQIIADRLEPEKILTDLAGRYACITSRAFTSIKDFLELSGPYGDANGRVICMKGPGAKKEISDWQHTHPDSKYTLMKIHTLHLPFSGKERNLLEFKIN